MDSRKQIISQFCDMTIDMDYMLCIPSVHARIKNMDIVMDFGGGIRDVSEDFPEEKIALLRKWVLLHRDEIAKNHCDCGRSEYPLDAIDPL